MADELATRVGEVPQAGPSQPTPKSEWKAYRSGPNPNDPSQVGKKAARVARDERRMKVAALALQRLTDLEIAKLVGCSLCTVSMDLKAVRMEWRDRAAEDVGKVVAQELAALVHDEARFRAKMASETGEQKNKTYDRILRIMERRAKLLGLDVQRVEVAGRDGGPIRLGPAAEVERPPDDKTASLERALRRMNPALRRAVFDKAIEITGGPEEVLGHGLKGLEIDGEAEVRP